MEHRSAHAHRRRRAASRGLTGGDAESRRTCPTSAGEDRDHVYRPRARPRPLGGPLFDPRGLRFTRTCTLTRTAAVSRWLIGTGTAPPDGGTSTPSPLGSGTVSSTPGPAPVVRGTSTGAARDVYTRREGVNAIIVMLAVNLFTLRKSATLIGSFTPRSVFRRVLGSTVTPVNYSRCFGYPKPHMFHVV